MVKVRILTGITAGTAAILAIPSLTGCSADAEAADTGEATDDNTASVAGSGDLTLRDYVLQYTSTSGGDEFVRVGEKMTTTVSLDNLLDKIAPRWDDGAVPLRNALKADPSKITVTSEVTYTKADESKSTASVAMTWAPGAGGIMAGKSAEFIIPERTKQLSLEIVAKYKDLAGADRTVSLIKGNGIRSDIVVFGAYLPNKIALFDTGPSGFRSRVVEGGGLVKGSQSTLSITDWRLDTIVDKTSLDLRIGERNSGSRFGPVVVDALGALEYEVSAAVSTDGGGNYQPLDLGKVFRPAALSGTDGMRFAHEAALGLAGNAGPNLKIAFHVRAFLQVPNFAPGEIRNARYAPGARVLLKDVWDNNGGQDYSLPIRGN